VSLPIVGSSTDVSVPRFTADGIFDRCQASVLVSHWLTQVSGNTNFDLTTEIRRRRVKDGKKNAIQNC